MCDQQMQDVLEFADEAVRVREEAQQYALGALLMAQRHLAAATETLNRVSATLSDANAYTMTHHAGRS